MMCSTVRRLLIGHRQHRARSAGGQEVEAREVDPGACGDAVLVRGSAIRVADRQAHPVEIAVEARAPDHGRDAARGRIEAENGRVGNARCHDLGRVGNGRRRVEPLTRDMIVGELLEPAGHLVAIADVLGEVVGEQDLVAVDPGEPPEQHDALGAQRLEAQSIGRPQPAAAPENGQLGR